MNIAIILAGGVGTRVGAEAPKQYIKIMGKPIMVYTLEKFENNPNIDAIELVCIKGDIPYVESIVKEYNITKVRWYTEGGSTFQESTMNGIFNLKDKVADDDIVLIQFAVSPMITDEIIDDSINVCEKYGMGDDWQGKFDYLKEHCEVVYLPRTPEVSTSQIKKDLLG